MTPWNEIDPYAEERERDEQDREYEETGESWTAEYEADHELTFQREEAA